MFIVKVLLTLACLVGIDFCFDLLKAASRDTEKGTNPLWVPLTLGSIFSGIMGLLIFAIAKLAGF